MQASDSIPRTYAAGPRSSSVHARPASRGGWSRAAIASGLLLSLLLSACGGDDSGSNTGSDGKAREVHCAR